MKIEISIEGASKGDVEKMAQQARYYADTHIDAYCIWRINDE